VARGLQPVDMLMSICQGMTSDLVTKPRYGIIFAQDLLEQSLNRKVSMRRKVKTKFTQEIAR
jgi:hypothetical protein